MKNKCCLGIHYSQQKLTAVIMEKTDTAPAKVLDVFPITLDSTSPEGANTTGLAALAADIRARRSVIRQITMALSGRFYQTLLHTTEFADPQQLAKTLKYDIEEDFSLDAESTTLCFQPLPGTDASMRLMVHTAERVFLEKLLHEFEQAHLDPLCVQPDLDAWLTYLCQPGILPPDKPLVAIAWYDGILFLLFLNAHHQPLIGRTIPCENLDYLETTLNGELNRTLASLPHDQHPQEACFHTENLAASLLDKICRPLAIPVHSLPIEAAGLAMAQGAALSWLNQSPTADFREDHLPPQSLIKTQKKALRALLGSAVLLLLVLTIIFNLFASQYAHLSQQHQQAIQQAWKDVNPGQNLPKKLSSVQLKLRQMSQKLVEFNNAAGAMDGSASNTFRLVLTSLSEPNRLPKDFDLQIDSLRMNGNTAYLSGSVSNLTQIVALFKAFEGDPATLEIGKWETKQSLSNQPGSGRYTFTMPLRVKTSGDVEEFKNARKY